jgi:hypothetical protein
MRLKAKLKAKESLVENRVRTSRIALTVSDSTLVMLRRKAIARELELQMRRNPPVVKKEIRVEERGGEPVPVPSIPITKYNAIVIPSGEGKSTLCKKKPEYFFDIDDLGKLPFKTVSVRKGDAYFYVETRDFSSIEWKVLLVGNRSQVPDQYQLIKEYALCECKSSHPHTGGLRLLRNDSIRYNVTDRQTLGSNVTCCSSFETRDLEMSVFLRKMGFYMGAAKHALYLRSKSAVVSAKDKEKQSDEMPESDLIKKLKSQLKVGVSVSVPLVEHDNVQIEDLDVSKKMPGYLSFFKGYRSNVLR